MQALTKFGGSVASTRGSAGSPVAVPKFQGSLSGCLACRLVESSVADSSIESVVGVFQQCSHQFCFCFNGPRAVPTYSRTAQTEIVDQARHEKQWLAREKQFFASDLDQTSDGLINDNGWLGSGKGSGSADAGTGVTNLRVFPMVPFILDFSGRETSREATAGTPFKHSSTHPTHPSITCVLCPVLCPVSHDFILSTSPQSPSQKDELLSRFLTVLALSVAQTAISDAMEAFPAVLDRCKPSDYVRR